MKIDLLAFGVHPDDVELGCAGVLLAEKKNAKKIGIIDLTQGELGTRGTAETRKEEADSAGRILGVDARENLMMADGFFENNEINQRTLITILRKYQPEIIFCNAPEDRHPDHGRSAKLVEDAAFLAGLSKIETFYNNELQKAWRPKYVFNFIQDRYLKPDFVIDISEEMEQKIESVKAYKTQFFNPDSQDGPQTYISSPEFLDSVIARAAMFGKMIGVKYAEGFLSKKMIGFKNIDALVQQTT
ncbi:MAG: bacillithiol biosynthesis deacetylase BshB1 [Ferruginibacter sp.]|nr:bacillithiol biosynthesis deacetylase BshB1 [Ferruginibacter sp.]